MFKREAEIGDRVNCQGKTFTIKEILSQDFYNCDYDDSKSYIDLEFKDLNGGYHHWKSWLDGGNLIYKEGLLLGKFYDKMSGRFYIPFVDMTAEVSEAVLRLMNTGYALAAYNDGDGNDVYTLFKLSQDCTGFRKVDFLKSKLYDWLHTDKGCHYFTRMNLNEYFSSALYQNAVDYALIQGGSYLGYTLALRCVDGKFIEFIEAKDCFV